MTKIDYGVETKIFLNICGFDIQSWRFSEQTLQHVRKTMSKSTQNFTSSYRMRPKISLTSDLIFQNLGVLKFFKIWAKKTAPYSGSQNNFWAHAREISSCNFQIHFLALGKILQLWRLPCIQLDHSDFPHNFNDPGRTTIFFSTVPKNHQNFLLKGFHCILDYFSWAPSWYVTAIITCLFITKLKQSFPTMWSCNNGVSGYGKILKKISKILRFSKFSRNL